MTTIEATSMTTIETTGMTTIEATNVTTEAAKTTTVLTTGAAKTTRATETTTNKMYGSSPAIIVAISVTASNAVFLAAACALFILFRRRSESKPRLAEHCDVAEINSP
ncbi:hypothetical protein RRG08_002534 [Elysia crispata]|uniref:Uncharacterized protein n=1 Tax=Elysia crispata TaxID=231223 RepID=A0AAE1EAY9_9GAST|nr:hypothetical protein RRG08_002534 [Elysia crispata]